ncbi:MAG: gluconokinase [Ramlibacter sp.]
MGVAGCGKSTVAGEIALALGTAFIEGDRFHSPGSHRKMRQGVALTDADRASWLDELGRQLVAHPAGAVLACSALRSSYRERLRAASPGLRFVFLEIGQALAQERVAARASSHFFPSSLVTSQFEALEAPYNEPGVLCLDAALPAALLAARALEWLCAPAPVTA